MSVTSVLLPDGSKANIGQIVTLHGEVQHGRSHPMLESLATACVVCNNSVPTYGKKRALGSPTETALMQFAQKLGLEDLRKDWQRIKEVCYRVTFILIESIWGHIIWPYHMGLHQISNSEIFPIE